MIKHLVNIGNSKGFIVDKTMLGLMKMTDDDAIDIEFRDGGLFIKPVTMKDIYKKRSTIHRKSLNKLGE
jgi:antitoxin component of MazEF toxin-antitoxin module